jgi:16S rRNA (uracil1498-N3)-methyltransferase
MRRFFVTPEELQDQKVSLTGDELHHLKNVCRLEEGEAVELLDGQGHIAKAKITAIDKKAATLEIFEKTRVEPSPLPHVHLILCLPRFQKMDLIIQKAVELGCYKITPVVSERSFVKNISKDVLGKIPRWQKISDEACKQSGRAWPMKWGEIQTLTATAEALKNSPSLFLYEGEASKNIKEALSAYKAPEILNVFVGAEGGFSPKEVETFEKRGMNPVTLGSLVLRVETACIAILSVIQYHFDLMT